MILEQNYELTDAIMLNEANKKRVLLWGLGQRFVHKKEHLLRLIDNNDLQVVGYTANCLEKQDETDFKYFGKDKLIPAMIDYIIVMTTVNYFAEIIKEAIKRGFKRDSIVFWDDLELNNYDWAKGISESRKNINLFLKKQKLDGLPTQFTLLAQNCAGGLLYHSLGREFLSPTINLWFSEGDFLKFVNKYRYYIKEDLNFLGWEDYLGEKTPCYTLQDIKIHMPHVYTMVRCIMKLNS